MTIATYNLVCNRCDYCTGSLKTWGIFVYEDDEGRYPCQHQLGWCADCAGFEPMEDFSNPELDSEDIDKAFAQLDSYSLPRWQRFLNRFSRRRRNRHRQWLAEARSELKARKHRYLRQGTERCLKCGSRSVTPFEGVINTPLTIEGVFEGRNATGVLHPGCGGELFAEGSGMRFSVRLATRVYSPDGIFLGKE